jgi:cytochrome c-type biogenesis protein CcmH/NrfG
MLRLVVGLFLATSFAAQAGVYYSQEVAAELPSQWRGFLIDQRALRFAAVAPKGGQPANPLREQYETEAVRLAKLPKPWTAETSADLGALYLRLGQPSKALEVLRQAARTYPEDFKIAANLGTAWQLNGDLNEASRAFQEAVRLAPSKYKKAEELHLTLVRERLKEPKNTATVDRLFDPKKPSPDDVALLQQLALWLPSDGRLLWQLAELAHAHHDVRIAAAILEGCVTELAMSAGDIRKRRQQFKEEAEAINKLPDSEHAKYRGDITFKSARPFIKKAEVLPEIRAEGVNQLPWSVLSETVIDKPFQPRFHKHLEQLDGKTVSLTGYMQPISMDIEVTGFMLIEYPIGCWFCETPEPAGILFVELDKSVGVKRSRVKVEGKLKLNKNDPEEFVYTIIQAKVTDPD